MDDIQKRRIIELRSEGYGYKRIAKELGLSVSTVSSYCIRNSVKADSDSPDERKEERCEYCGQAMHSVPGYKKKRFCCDSCRNKWWNAHLDLVNRKAIYKFRCEKCGKEFEVYGNKNRKYCSYDCFVKDRFGGGQDE